MKFRDLKVGQSFTFTPRKGRSPGEVHFWNAAKKVSTRCYVWAAKTGGGRATILKSCVGSTGVEVTPGPIRSARVPKGRGR